MESAYTLYFRLAMFAAHAATAVFFLVQGFRSDCGAVLSRSHFTSYMPLGFPVDTPADGCGPPNYPNATSLGLPTADWRDVWCQATSTPRMWDVTQDVRSLTPGAAWNVLILILVFEWVTASFALVYTQEPSALWASVPVPPGTVAQPFIATLWNLTLLVVLWVCRAQLRVPDNNLLIYTAVFFASMVAQNYMARPRDNETPETQPLIAPTPVSSSLAWQTDMFLGGMRRRKNSGDRSNSVTIVGAGAQFAVHSLQYHEAMYSTGGSVAARMFEYACTAPLLLVGIMLNMNTSGLTWHYQIAYVSLLVCNLMGGIVHHAALADKPKARIAGWIALAASWVAFLCGFAVYTFIGRDFLLASPASSGMPDWVLALIWTVLLGYGSFGVVFTYYYYPLLMASPVDARQVTSSVATWLDFLSLVVKLAVAWTVYSKGSIVNCKGFEC